MRDLREIPGAKNIFAIDITVHDTTIPIDLVRDLAIFYGLTEESTKKVLDISGAIQFKRALDALPPDMASRVNRFHGGSMANLAVQLGKTFKNRGVTWNMMTAVGGEESMVERVMAEYNAAGINLIPSPEHFARFKEKPEMANSMVVLLEEGGRAIGTYSSNAILFLNKDLITREFIESQDLIILPGSLRTKLGHEIFDTILKLAWELKKPVIMPLPTSAYSSKNAALYEYFRYVMPSMTVLSNIEELSAVYHIELPAEEKLTQEQLKDKSFIREFERAREALEQRALERLAQELAIGRDNLRRETGVLYTPVAFVTRGKRGGSVIVAEGNNIERMITHVVQQPVEITGSTLGAGDTAYFAIIMALLLGKEPPLALESGMFASREKLAYTGPRIINPLEVFKSKRPADIKRMDRIYPLKEVPTVY